MAVTYLFGVGTEQEGRLELLCGSIRCFSDLAYGYDSPESSRELANFAFSLARSILWADGMGLRNGGGLATSSSNKRPEAPSSSASIPLL